MGLSTIQHTYNLLHPPKRLNCPRTLWSKALRELRSRGGGRRESGGFFLGTTDGPRRYATEFVPYDEIDPKALQGIIVFDASRMNKVWSYCETRGIEVVADVHTHPGSGYGQSGVDRDNPMIPQRGHLALIVPNYADKIYKPGEFGIYEFCGREGWRDHSRLGSAFMRLGWL
jgi:proteasome lid subunit RPN8/RPN11